MMKFIAASILATTVAASNAQVVVTTVSADGEVSNAQWLNSAHTVKQSPNPELVYVYGEKYDPVIDDSQCCTCHGCQVGVAPIPGDYQAMNENCCCKFCCPMFYIWTYPGQCGAGWANCVLSWFLGWPALIHIYCCWQPPTTYKRYGDGSCNNCCNDTSIPSLPEEQGCCMWPYCVCLCQCFCGCCGGEPPIVKIVKKSVAAQKFGALTGGADGEGCSTTTKVLMSIGLVLFFVAVILAAFVAKNRTMKADKKESLESAEKSQNMENYGTEESTKDSEMNC